MKKTMVAFSTPFVFGMAVIVGGISVYAETRQERYQRLQYETCQKYLDELEADGMLTQDAIDALDGPNSTRKPNYKSGRSSNNSKESSSDSYTTQGKGWVYSSERHPSNTESSR